ncbi:MAG: TonB-dependent receptor [Gammaproteobacteria bacterium]
MDRARLTIPVLLVCAALFCEAAAAGSWLGQPLTDYIESLDLPVIYSSDLVPPDLRVAREPTAQDPEYALRQVLAASALGLISGPDGSLLVVATQASGAERVGALTGAVRTVDGQRLTGAEVLVDGESRGQTGRAGDFLIQGLPPGEHRVQARMEGYATAERELEVRRDEVAVADLILPLAPRALPDLVVTSSLHRLIYATPGSHTFLDRQRLLDLPNLADDPLRAAERLPGVAGGNLSARAHVRGGEETETLVLFDGLRLYEPFHLKDFQNVVSTLEMQAVGGIDYYSGGFPARYGDRMSAVMDISMRRPVAPRQTEVRLDFLNAGITSLGTFEAGDGEWLAAVRRGNLDLVFNAVNPDLGTPRYLDLLLHAERNVGRDFRVGANALLARDKIGVSDSDASSAADARYDNRYLWFSVDWFASPRLTANTVLSASLIDNAREGYVDRPGVIQGRVIRDERDFRIFGLKQDWEFEYSDDSFWRAGFDLKHIEGEYEYASERRVDPLFATLAGSPQETRAYSLSPGGAQFSVYAEHRWEITDRLVADLGLRWDQQTYTTAADDEQVSPRVSLLFRPRSGQELRLSWGRYYQAQELNELRVGDGQPEFQEAERSEHLILSAVQDLDRFRFRLELYRKRMRSLADRFENLTDPLTLIPELQPDRVRLAPIAATARGAELLVTRRNVGEAFSWWASYAWSEVLDQFPDGKVFRSWDQTHALKFGLDWSFGRWDLSVAANLHTGWPQTRLVLVEGDEGPVVMAEPRNRRRYDSFHRLDMRLARQFDLSRGDLEAYLEVTNLYNGRNPCCLEYSQETAPDGTVVLVEETNYWLPLVPSLGIVWRFE